MGDFLRRPSPNHYWCRGCTDWHYYTDLCPREHPDAFSPPTDQARQAVVDVAFKVADVFKRWESLPATGWDDDDKLVEALRDLSEVTTALTTPAGKAPTDVEPGTRFTWAKGSRGSRVHDGGRVVSVAINDTVCSDFMRGWIVEDREWEVYHFRPEDRIIPIPEDT